MIYHSSKGKWRLEDIQICRGEEQSWAPVLTLPLHNCLTQVELADLSLCSLFSEDHSNISLKGFWWAWSQFMQVFVSMVNAQRGVIHCYSLHSSLVLGELYIGFGFSSSEARKGGTEVTGCCHRMSSAQRQLGCAKHPKFWTQQIQVVCKTQDPERAHCVSRCISPPWIVDGDAV